MTNMDRKFKGISLRLSAQAERELRELMRAWGESASAAIRRAIAQAVLALKK